MKIVINYDLAHNSSEIFRTIERNLTFSIISVLGLFKFSNCEPQSTIKTSQLLIHEADPAVTAGSDHCFCTCRPSVRPHFSKQNNFKLKQCLLLVRLWVWPSGSLMTSVLKQVCFCTKAKVFKWHTFQFLRHARILRIPQFDSFSHHYACLKLLFLANRHELFLKELKGKTRLHC